MFLMKPRIIIADDSQTIQKVIKITLASEDFELVECLTDDSLLALVQENNPSLVLLDFNLSENKTGYDLAKEIKAICQPKIMMLYGTFDSIDETLLEETGVNGHIVKPFDGNKFINSCRQLISDSELETSDDTEDFEELEEIKDEVESEIDFGEEFDDGDEIDFSESEEDFLEVEDENLEVEEFEEISSPMMDLESNKDEISIDEEWVVNQPQNIEEDDGLPEEIVTKEELNTLEAGMQEWGIDVPGIIGQSTSGPELPPVIGEEPQIMTTTSIGTVEHIEIENVELKPELEVEVEPQLEIEVSQPNKEEIVIDDFPDEIIDVQEEIVENVVPEDDDLEYPDSLKIIEEVSKEETFSSLIPISELSDEVEFSDEIQTDGISLNDTLGTNTEEEIKALEEQIADEVDEEKNLWSTDEVVEEADLQKNNMDMAIERVKASQESQITPTPQIKISEEEIRSRVEELLGPMVERIVREKIDSVIEKVSWEVIPDLAENIIKRELKQVTEEILQDN
ncbi:MAG: DNA-binding response OmpR family regulator [Bacteriovoracaceae bacterium]|jgi:DNA-binding response OmpR family regulator